MKEIIDTDLRLDMENTCLWRGNQEIPLPPKTFAILQYLLEHPGQIIGKEVLLASIWDNEPIGETALTSIIRDLRQILGDDSKNPRFIETRHRLGYRWIGPDLAIQVFPPRSYRTTQFQDWGESIDTQLFCGRETELATLRQWVLQDRCRLVALLGLGGIGKSALSVKFAQQIAGEFDYLIWRSLRNAPPLADLVQDLVKFLSDGRETQGDLPQLFQYLRSARCLVVLDNIETILQNSRLVGHYRAGYEGYGELFWLAGETPHSSCVILTSREKPAEVSLQEGNDLAVKSLALDGSLAAARALLQAKGLVGSDQQQEQLCQRYDCSPLAIKIVSTSIKELFSGQIQRFLAQEVTIFGDIDQLLSQQFSRMSALEQTITYWLAIHRDLTSLAQLEADIVPMASKLQLMSALESLSRRSFLEQQAGQYTLQPVVMEYITHRLIEQVGQELLAAGLVTDQGAEADLPHLLVISHALTTTNAIPEIRESQIRLILAPIANQLQTALRSPQALRSHLQRIVRRLQLSESDYAYAAGNLINLARYLAIDLTGWDFARLSIWHANLQGTTLHRVNFAQCHFANTVFTQIFAGVLTLAYSPDGQILAYGDASGAVHLWQIAKGELLFTLKQHRGWVWCLAWSADGQTLATGGDDKTVRLWDVNRGEPIKTLTETNSVWSLAWSPDGQTLASSSFDKTIKLWHPDSGICLQTLTGHEDLVASVAWHPDGSVLASGSLDHSIKLWNWPGGDCHMTLKAHRGGVRAVAWSPNGDTLASGSADGTVKLWRPQTGKVRKTLVGHEKLVASLSWSPKGDRLVSGSYDQQVMIWNASSGLAEQIFQEHRSEVWAVAWSPSTLDGAAMVASGSYDKTVKLWNVDLGESVHTLQGRTSGVCSLAWSADDRLLASGSEDNTIRLWDPQTGSCLKTLQGHGSEVWSVAWSPVGANVSLPAEKTQLLASGSGDRSIKLWDVQTGKCLKTLTGYDDWVLSVAWNPVQSVTPSPDWLLAGGSACRQVIVWNSATSKPVQTFASHIGFVWSVAWSADGTRLASGSADAQIRVWDGQTGRCLATLQGHTGFIWSVAWRADTPILASGSDDGTIKLWDMEKFKLLDTWPGHKDSVRALAWSPDGKLLASGSHDGEIRLWDGENGKPLRILPGHSDRVYDLAWSQDGLILASSSADEMIMLWDVGTGACLRTLSPERPYQDTNIAHVSGLTAAQESTLFSLGAISL